MELRPEIRKFKNDAKSYIPRIVLQSDTIVNVDLIFHYPQRHANGKLRRRDVHNGVKVILDLIAEKCGFDDCRVKSGSWASVDSESEKVEVVLREVVR